MSKSVISNTVRIIIFAQLCFQSMTTYSMAFTKLPRTSGTLRAPYKGPTYRPIRQTFNQVTSQSTESLHQQSVPSPQLPTFWPFQKNFTQPKLSIDAGTSNRGWIALLLATLGITWLTSENMPKAKAEELEKDFSMLPDGLFKNSCIKHSTESCQLMKRWFTEAKEIAALRAASNSTKKTQRSNEFNSAMELSDAHIDQTLEWVVTPLIIPTIYALFEPELNKDFERVIGIPLTPLEEEIHQNSFANIIPPKKQLRQFQDYYPSLYFRRSDTTTENVEHIEQLAIKMADTFIKERDMLVKALKHKIIEGENELRKSGKHIPMFGANEIYEPLRRESQTYEARNLKEIAASLKWVAACHKISKISEKCGTQCTTEEYDTIANLAKEHPNNAAIGGYVRGPYYNETSTELEIDPATQRHYSYQPFILITYPHIDIAYFFTRLFYNRTKNKLRESNDKMRAYAFISNVPWQEQEEEQEARKESDR